MLRKIIHHPEASGLAVMATMVFCMSNYNLVWRYGFGNHHFQHEAVIYPIALTLVFLTKKFISAPIVGHLHKRSQWLSQRPRHISFPFLIISCNTLIVIAVTTLVFKNYMPSHYLFDYLRNWIRAFVVAIPVFFFIVRPLVTRFVMWLQTKVAAPMIEEI